MFVHMIFKTWGNKLHEKKIVSETIGKWLGVTRHRGKGVSLKDVSNFF